MTNAIRGEVEVTLGEKTYTMRPTFSALAAIEADTDTVLIMLASRFQAGLFSASDTVTVLYRGIVNTKKPTKAEIGELLMTQGWPSVRDQVTKFMESVLTFYTGEDDEVDLDAPADPPKGMSPVE